MKHYGDITKLDGYTLPVVDCICGGSPCQDLSIAGRRGGLQAERSGLFMEQIRIVKEMREHDRKTNDNYRLYPRPRYMVWENVPGALSSPGKDRTGEDFQAVLTEIVKIVRPDAPDVPLPKGGRWSKAGCVMGYGADGQPFSIAYRVHDAQFWGVAQRRKRIALVADFGGLSAGEVLFERNGVCGDNQEEREARKGIAEAITGCVDATSERIKEQVEERVNMDGDARAVSFQERFGKPGGGKGILYQNEHVGALTGVNNQSVFCLQGGGATSQNAKGSGVNEDVAFTLNATDRHGVAYGSDSYESIGLDAGYYSSAEEKMPTLCARQYKDPPIVYRKQGHPVNASQGQGWEEATISDTINTYDNTDVRASSIVLEPVKSAGFDGSMGAKAGNIGYKEEQAPTLNAGKQMHTLCLNDQGGSIMSTNEEMSGTLRAQEHGHNPIVYGTSSFGAHKEEIAPLRAQGGDYGGGSENLTVAGHVRRLTPLECERLQGFPDGWTDIGEWTDTKGKTHKTTDSARYTALGNSIAVGYANNQSGFWMWLMKRISAQYERRATLGSLFDGIGGFPLAWETYNGKGSAVWASEIEEFPIAVTKRHFPEEG